MFRRLYEEMQCEMMNKHPYDDIISSLGKIQEKLANNEEVDWKFVRLHIGMAIPTKRLTEDFCGFLYVIFQEILMKYQCRDFSIIADALQIYSFVREGSKKSFQKARIMIDNFINNEACFEKKGFDFVAKLMKMPYKYNSFIPYEPMYDVIQSVVLTRSVHQLKFFLEFGVMYIPLSDHRSTWNHCYQRLTELLTESEEEKRMLLSFRDFQNYVKGLCPASRQRMLAVFRAVELMLKSRDTFIGLIDYLICFKMAFETIPEPIITGQEMSKFLHSVLSGPSSDKLIETLCKEYESYYPEATKPLTPRSLKHLSRCQVRQNIREKGAFPFAVLDTNYPQAVKDYILARLDHKFVQAEYNSIFGDNYIIPYTHFD